MRFVQYLNGDIEVSSESGSSVSYLPIIHWRKIEGASPIATVRVRLSDFGHGDFFTFPLLSTYQVLCSVIYIPRTRTRHLCNPVHPQWQQLLAL